MTPQFSDAADLILDAIEDAFGLIAPLGRQIAKKSVMAVLGYYCLPNPERNTAAKAEKNPA